MMAWFSSWLSSKQCAVKHENLAHVIVLANLQWMVLLQFKVVVCVLRILPQTISQEIPKGICLTASVCKVCGQCS